MKVIDKSRKNETRITEVYPFIPLNNIEIDSIAFSRSDFEAILRLTDGELRNYLTRLQTRCTK